MKVLVFVIFAGCVCGSFAGLPNKRKNGGKGLYEECNPESNACKSGLVCWKAVNLCVNSSCDTSNDECRVKCAVVDKCTEENTYKSYFACGCCSRCEKYLEQDETCSHEPGAQKCAPGLECCLNTNTCQELHKRDE